MSYEFETFGSDQYEAYRALFERQETRPDEKTLSRRRWWCFDNPYGGAFSVAIHEGKVVATCYLAGKRLKLNGRERAVYEIGESATDAEHRRKGLFSALGKACANYAFQHGGDFVYGTPNKQATPGWIKIDFAILRDSLSWLFLIPNVHYWVPMLGSFGRLFGRTVQSAVMSVNEYIELTTDFPRLNASNRDYLTWRLAESPSDYRFLKLETPSGLFCCAIKYGALGRYPVLVCAEYFLDGRKPDTAQTASLLRQACRGMFDPRSYAGIYFHAGEIQGRRSLVFLTKGVVAHRQLPICLKAPVENASVDFDRFQLSDCDIG